ncbi:MAG: hypothetical protein GY943_25730 [Chloroflexi bacterium]|nr:hypothetical protein [Chloroflexota bacterium]
MIMKNLCFVLIVFFVVGCTVSSENSDSFATNIDATPLASKTPITTPITETPEITLERPTASVEPTVTMTESPTPAPTVTRVPTATTTPMPSPTATVVAICPDANLPEPLADFQTSGELQQAISDYINQGGKLNDLQQSLDIITEPEIVFHGVEADLNGDDVLELIITIDTLDSTVEDHSRIIVFQCFNEVYEEVYINTGGIFGYLFHPISVVDVNGDSRYEFIIEHDILRSAFGWSLSIYSLQNNEVVDLYIDTGSVRLGSVTDWYLQDINNDGTQELIIIGSTIFHSEGGFPRNVVQTFELTDDGTYYLLAIEYLPSEYRHQVLGDAQRAFESDDLVLAATLYDQAAHDNDLMNIGSYRLGYLDNSTDLPNEYQRAFALFRLLSVQLLLEEDQRVIDETIVELNTMFPENSVGGEFTTLAQILQMEVASGKSLYEACREVTRIIGKRFSYLDLHIGYWGYLNTSYENETICILPRQK